MEMLFKQIKKDLESLYSTDRVFSAKKLNDSFSKPFFSEKKPPMYFTGKLDAKTVFVMLNPGSTNDECYSFARTHKFKYDDFDSFLNKYLSEHENYGQIDYCRKDNFDLKQASFLYFFKNSGLSFPNFLSDLENPKLHLDAKEEVLMNKLQLELIPYCSVNFDKIIDNRKDAENTIDIFMPHLIRLFDTITNFERKFVILGAKKFVHILEAYEIKKPGHVVFGELYTSKIEGIAKNVNWQTVTIKYNSKAINAIIPFSFPRRDLPNAHQKMAEYGKLCFESFITNFQIS
jgi:hypothetical protein